MFERFTDRARRVVVLSQEEAKLLNHNYIGTEHILLGLVREGEGVAATALAALGVSRDSIEKYLREKIGSGGEEFEGHIPFTPRSKKVFELSLREALQLGHNYIGTEHILLGLIREGEGVACEALKAFGLDLSLVRKKIIELLVGYSTTAKDTAKTDSKDGVFTLSKSTLPAKKEDIPYFRVWQDGEALNDWRQFDQSYSSDGWKLSFQMLFDHLPSDQEFVIEIQSQI